MNRNKKKKEIIICSMVITVVLMVSGKDTKGDFFFGEPENLGASINSINNDLAEHITNDGLELYFSSVDRSGGYGKCDLWVSTRITTEDEWSAPVNLGPIVNSSAEDQQASITADGLELYFNSDRPEGVGDWDIWVCKRMTKDDPWGEPANLGTMINTSMFEAGIISSDGLNLYINSFSRPGEGGCDIWVSSRATRDETWSVPVNIGPTVNSSFNEIVNSISANGLTLFFCDFTGGFRTDGLGNRDIWMTTRTSIEESWGIPINLGQPINSSFLDGPAIISCDNRTMYFISDRPGGVGEGDIWQASIESVVDLNGDGIVDAVDMCIIVGNWGTDNSLCDIGPTPFGDGVVDVEDLIVLAEHLFEEFPPAVPGTPNGEEVE